MGSAQTLNDSTIAHAKKDSETHTKGKNSFPADMTRKKTIRTGRRVSFRFGMERNHQPDPLQRKRLDDWSWKQQARPTMNLTMIPASR